VSDTHDVPDPPFFWGVATSAYQSEGGYNGPGEPRTNWARAEEHGQVARVGPAVEFWSRYESDFQRTAAMGCRAFRLGIEWTRVQPGPPLADDTPPPWDEPAIAHYAEMIAACRRAGLEPFVTLQHFVHPEWLGEDAWIQDRTPGLFAEFVRKVTLRVNELLVEAHGQEPIHYYLTINEPNMLVLNTHVASQFPGGHRRGSRAMAAALDGLLTAHVLAYGLIKEIHTAKGWPTPEVTLNTYTSDLYWSDKVILDLLMLRERGVPRGRYRQAIRAQADAFEKSLKQASLPLHKDLPYWIGSIVRKVAHWFGRRNFDPEHFPRLIEALEAAPHERVMDFIGMDYYDPFMAHLFRLPVFWDHEFKNRSLRAWVMNTITSKWWDWRVLPRGLHWFCETYAKEYERPILLAENGMALRRKPDNRKSQRRDRMTRSQYLRLFVHQVSKMRKEGIPLLGYLHWSLFDNYEWGSYTPRFGLFAINYTRDRERLVETDAGDRPSETYRDLIATAEEDACDDRESRGKVGRISS